MHFGRLLPLAAACLAVLISPAFMSTSSALEPPRPDQESSLTTAVFAGNELWVLSDSGVLSSMKEADEHWTAAPITDPVFELCATGDRVMVLTGKREVDFPAWTLLRHDEGRWTKVTTIERAQDASITLHCQADGAMLLTSRRLIDLSTLEPKVVELHGAKPFGRVNVGFGTSDDFYVGANSGEWDGGLHHIDPRTGAISAVARNASGDLCGGPLNTDCDPVTGIAAEPWKPECIAVKIGLVHMMTHGRIVEICGDRVRELYAKSLEGSEHPAYETVAFFGIVAKGEELWASGVDGLYRVSKDGKAEITPLPEFRNFDGISVSFDLPGIILVELSEDEPVLVPR